MLAHKKTSLTIEDKFNWSRSSGFGDFRGLTLFTHSLLKEDKNRLCSPAANFRAQLTNVTKQQQTLPFQTPYRLQRNRFTWPFNHKMVDLRMIVTKTRLQVNGLVKYNCSTEGNISRRMKTKKGNNILRTSIPYWPYTSAKELCVLGDNKVQFCEHFLWISILSKLLCFEPKQCPLRKENTKQISTAGLKKLQLDCSFIQFSVSGHKFL